MSYITPTVRVSILAMNQSSEALRWTALAALALTTTAIQAGILNVYSDEASFRSALSGIVLEGSFAGLPADTGYVSLVGGGGTPPLTYTMSSPGDGVYVFPAVAGFAQSIGQNAIGFPVLINGFSQSITAIGGYFFNLGYPGDLPVPVSGKLSLRVTDKSGTYSFAAPTSPVTSPGTFFGFTTTSPILSFELASPDERYASMTSLITGFAAVPEPPKEVAPVMSWTQTAAGLSLTWADGVLQAADTVNGTFADAPGSSPLVITADRTARFYRLRR